ncbi:amidohydrolase family protein [Shewanella sp. MMG014]|uniref:amidohydrolase family protein n=1 Tax=Shewanella sp. MMG014 TaxID=2822691 RepID=UPI001B38C1D8|nr:amidohydrolase family protein [Shewanella sp. MMG014]MBQ4891596.1 amidohydrolase family protein [Shewanella sp. MMG014]
MKKVSKITPLVIAMALIGGQVQAQDFDIVINEGRVMDPETGFDQVANIGIKDGKILSITKDIIEGKQSINAKGLVVAPGFIDTHSHVSNIPFGQKLHLRDGVTTPLDLEVGSYPVNAFYDRLEGKSITNYGTSVSPAGIRESIVNPDYNSRTGSLVTDLFEQHEHEHSHATLEVATFLPNKEQIEKINNKVAQEMGQGAIGVGVPVGYMSAGTTSAETISWQETAAQYGSSTYLHGRFSSQNPSTTGILGFQEMISNVGIYGGGLLIQHIHQQSLEKTPEALKMIADARKAGLKVSAEVYPYYQGATIVGADYLVPDNYGPNMGRTYKDIIEVETMKPLTKERYDELVASNPSASVIFAGISQQGMLDALVDENVHVGSDAMPLTIAATGQMAVEFDTPYEGLQGHPRAAGTHGKVLRLVREKNIMPLMTAISKMSYKPAKYLQENGVHAMENKGRIQVNKDADITIFDPATVTDNATLTDAGLPTTGIPYVLINGTVIVNDSVVLKDIYPGQPVRN